MRTQPIVGILIFDDVEVLDFCGPFEVFSVARQETGTGSDGPAFSVVTIAEQHTTVRCRGGLLVHPHHTITSHPPLDILVVPGGRGTRAVAKNQAVLDWIAAQSDRVSLMTSVCTGAGLLALAGLLDGKRATTHWSAIEALRAAAPTTIVEDDVRFVDEGSLITSAGVSAGIDMALHIVKRLCGAETAHQTAREMEYDWHPGSPGQSNLPRGEQAYGTET